MSRRKLNGFKSSSIGPREMQPRESRHGRPIVGDSGPYQKLAVVKRERKVTENPKTGELEVQHIETIISVKRPLTFDEVQIRRNEVKRALDSTTPGGQKNMPPEQKKAPVGRSTK